jgi:hypothetical protein
MSANSENGNIKGSSKLSLLGNIALITGLFIVIAGGIVGWLMPPPPPPAETISLTEKKSVLAEPINILEAFSPTEKNAPEVEAEEVLEIEEVLLVDTNQVPPLPIKYYVQVANCLDRECVGQHRRLLSRQGYRTRIENTIESMPFQEVRSQPLYSSERAAAVAEEINQDPGLNGYAQVLKPNDWYRIGLGVFPGVDQADRLTKALNAKYARRISFDHIKVHLDFEHIRIYAGGYREEKKAQRLKIYLEKREPLFRGLFVTALLPRD